MSTDIVEEVAEKREKRSKYSGIVWDGGEREQFCESAVDEAACELMGFSL